MKQLNQIHKQLNELQSLTKKLTMPIMLSNEEVDLLARVLKTVKFKNKSDVILARSILGKLGYEERKRSGD